MEMVGQGGQGSSVKSSVHFIHFYPLKKPNFSSVWHGSLSRWLPFEHSGTKMGSLNIDPVHSTLCPSITSTRSTTNFHFNTFQYNVSGLVMLDTFIYGKDCILRFHSHHFFCRGQFTMGILNSKVYNPVILYAISVVQTSPPIHNF